jgi:RNA polymerase sigma-70 factor (ECF subfamily)
MPSLPLLPNEDALVASAQRGSLDAFTTLYEHFLPMVYNRVRYIVPEEDVEDVTQDIFIAAIRSLKSFRGESRFGTWLRTITNRRIAEYYRRKRKPDEPLNENLRAPHDPAAFEEAFLLRQAFRKLPQNYREVLLLRIAESMPFKEIATLQGVHLEAAKSLFRRALAALYKQVSRHG